VPFSRKLDPLFWSEVPKTPTWIGRSEHLAGLGAIVLSFQGDPRARFVGRIRAPVRPGEPQSSTGGEQRDYHQEKTFSFHYVLHF